MVGWPTAAIAVMMCSGCPAVIWWATEPQARVDRGEEGGKGECENLDVGRGI